MNPTLKLILFVICFAVIIIAMLPAAFILAVIICAVIGFKTIVTRRMGGGDVI